jgi:hypothetical protein
MQKISPKRQIRLGINLLFILVLFLERCHILSVKADFTAHGSYFVISGCFWQGGMRGKLGKVKNEGRFGRALLRLKPSRFCLQMGILFALRRAALFQKRTACAITGRGRCGGLAPR